MTRLEKAMDQVAWLMADGVERSCTEIGRELMGEGFDDRSLGAVQIAVATHMLHLRGRLAMRRGEDAVSLYRAVGP